MVFFKIFMVVWGGGRGKGKRLVVFVWFKLVEYFVVEGDVLISVVYLDFFVMEVVDVEGLKGECGFEIFW